MRRPLAILSLALPLAACGAPDDRLPSVHDQRIAATEDVPVSFPLDATDPDGDSLVWTVAEPAHGTLTVADGIATYTPDRDFTGADLVEVTASDGPRFARAYVIIDVAAVPDAPRPRPDTFPAVEDEPLYLASYALLANDVDPDGDRLWITDVTAISGGEIRLGDDEVIFTPTADRAGMARFTYTVTDGSHDAVNQVVLRVGGVNDAPVPTGDLLTTVEDQAVEVEPATLVRNDVDPDGDNLTVIEVRDAVGGEVSLVDRAIRFVPATDVHGVAGFTYVVSDGLIERDARVTVSIDGIEDAPDAATVTVAAEEDKVVVIPVSALRAGAHDGDGDPLVVTAVDQPSLGSVGLIGDEVRFVPAPDATGTAGFRYTVSDGVHAASAWVEIELAPVDDPPVAQPQVRVAAAGAWLTIAMTGHDVDDVVAFQVIEAPRHGALRPGAAADEIEYLPDPDFVGEDALIYVAHGGAQISAPARVTLIVPDTRVCGDGVVDPGEACDDGNQVDGDGCDHVCSVTACGNGIVASPAVTSATLRWLGATCSGSAAPIVLSVDGVDVLSVPGGDGACGCDEPVRSAALPPAAVAALAGQAVVTVRFAGNDTHLAWAELTLTTGAGSVGGAVRALPLYSAGVRLRGAPWPEQLCQTANAADVGATSRWLVSEECDDGNLIADDGCSPVCTVEACGDGARQAGEACDDGNLIDGDGCTASCTIEPCGDGLRVAGEACDDGNRVDGDGCTRDCALERCGDLVVQPALGEECDDGNLAPGDGCSATCTEE